ncbi:hypothetical protein DFH06DRAFT_1079714 [Mycena polygramma]|nr:hypothetical protein DFH06DRAFT_1079714 [Mycena polygramma]
MTYAVDSDELSNLKWTKIMQVCWRWHHLGLAAQPLWAFVDFGWRGHKLRWDRLYGQLERSGVAPLTLKIARCDSEHLSIIFQHSSRIQVLEVSGEARAIHDLLADVSNHDFPILTSLSLDPSSKRDEIQEGFTAVLPDSVVNGGIPNLHDLALTFINLPWSSVRGLKSLSLTDSINSDSGSVQTFAALFEMLRACSQLHTLRLEKVLPMQDDLAGERTVALPALSHLWLRNHVSVCRTVLNHLDFPSNAVVHLFPTDVRTGEDVRELLVPIRRRMRVLAGPAPSLLMIECHGSDKGPAPPSYLTMSTYTALPELLNRDTSSFVLNSHPRNDHEVRQILAKVIKALPFRHITHLDLRLATYPKPLSWHTVLRILPSLETVYIQANLGGIQFVNALIEVEQSLQSHPEQKPYHNIRHIHLLAAVADRNDKDLCPLLALLQTYLQLCHKCGTPLSIFEIDERHFCLSKYEKQLEAMFSLVGEKMIRNGKVYDPVKLKQEHEARLAEWRVRRAERGIVLSEDLE